MASTGGDPVTAKPLRVHAILNATLPRTIALASPLTRLWVVAERKGQVAGMLAERGIRCEAISGATRPGWVVENLAGLGLLNEPAVYAWPMPHRPDSPVVRVDSPSTVKQVAVMGDVLAHLAPAEDYVSERDR